MLRLVFWGGLGLIGLYCFFFLGGTCVLGPGFWGVLDLDWHICGLVVLGPAVFGTCVLGACFPVYLVGFIVGLH